jgi:hypothetical protein
MHSPTRWATWAVMMVSVLAGGCSSGTNGDKVTGSVLLDGKPLAQARVSFMDQSLGASVNTAVTDESGKFEVKTDKAGRTLVPGTYGVFIHKYARTDGKAPDPEEDTEQLIIAGTMRNVVPVRYSTLGQYVLSAEIKPGDNTLPPFELTSR